jgi:hypothetical protein
MWLVRQLHSREPAQSHAILETESERRVA